jgi:hypothetical protein
MKQPATLGDVRDYAQQAWTLFTRERNLTATLTWSEETGTPDGGPLVSAQVGGQGAAHALQRFTSSYHVVLGAYGDQRPQFDYTDPGRVVCFWRKSGVWIELWAPAGSVETPEPAVAPEPVQAASAPSLTESVASALRGLGDRLPTTRRKKETTRA